MKLVKREGMCEAGGVAIIRLLHRAAENIK